MVLNGFGVGEAHNGVVLDGLAPGMAVIDRGAGQVVEGEAVQILR